jgi:hypothetical protein
MDQFAYLVNFSLGRNNDGVVADVEHSERSFQLSELPRNFSDLLINKTLLVRVFQLGASL